MKKDNINNLDLLVFVGKRHEYLALCQALTSVIEPVGTCSFQSARQYKSLDIRVRMISFPHYGEKSRYGRDLIGRAQDDVQFHLECCPGLLLYRYSDDVESPLLIEISYQVYLIYLLRHEKKFGYGRKLNCSCKSRRSANGTSFLEH
jgi:hypothetical protein